MKYIYILLLTAFVFASCSTEEEPLFAYPTNDVAIIPTIPSLVYPTNNLICTNFHLDFEWNRSVTVFKGPITYIVEIATDKEFTNILFVNRTEQTETIFTLENGTTYFWRVKARNIKGYESRYSGVQSFFTEPNPVVNTIPAVSTTVTPTLGQTVSGSTASLDWNATDSDGDALLYDLYFGETNPPILFAENIEASTLDVNVSTNKTYYWRVAAKDNKQGVAISQVWNFQTN